MSPSLPFASPCFLNRLRSKIQASSSWLAFASVLLPDPETKMPCDLLYSTLNIPGPFVHSVPFGPLGSSSLLTVAHLVTEQQTAEGKIILAFLGLSFLTCKMSHLAQAAELLYEVAALNKVIMADSSWVLDLIEEKGKPEIEETGEERLSGSIS